MSEQQQSVRPDLLQAMGMTPPAAPQQTAPPASDATPANPPAQTPPAGEDPFSSKLSQITGGLIKSDQDLQAFLPKIQEYDTLKTKASELEAAAAQSAKFANDWVKGLNDLVASGADQSRITNFVTLSTLNIDQMSPLEAIAKKIGMEHPGMQQSHIDAYLLETYGYAGDDEVKTLNESTMPPAMAAKLQMDATAARKFLSEQRVEMSKVDPSVMQPQKPAVDEQMLRVQADTAAATWAPVINAHSGVINFEVEASQDEGRPEYKFDFNPRPEVVQQAKEALMGEIRRNPGAYPANEQTATLLKQTLDMYVRLASQDDMLRAMFNDVFNSARQMAATKYAGRVPSSATSQAQAQPVQQGGKPDIMSLVNKR